MWPTCICMHTPVNTSFIYFTMRPFLILLFVSCFAGDVRSQKKSSNTVIAEHRVTGTLSMDTMKAVLFCLGDAVRRDAKGRPYCDEYAVLGYAVKAKIIFLSDSSFYYSCSGYLDKNKRPIPFQQVHSFAQFYWNDSSRVQSSRKIFLN